MRRYLSREGCNAPSPRHLRDFARIAPRLQRVGVFSLVEWFVAIPRRRDTLHLFAKPAQTNVSRKLAKHVDMSA